MGDPAGVSDPVQPGPVPATGPGPATGHRRGAGDQGHRPGWLRCRFATHFVSGGFLEADGEIWDRADRLVAQSRQLALAPRQ